MLVVIKKCEFFTRKTDFIEFIVKPRRINIDLKKIEAIVITEPYSRNYGGSYY